MLIAEPTLAATVAALVAAAPSTPQHKQSLAREAALVSLPEYAKQLPVRRAPVRHNRLDRLQEQDLRDEDPKLAAALGVLKDLWREVGGYFPGAKGMPPAEFFSRLQDGSEAETTWGSTVRFSRPTARAIGDPADPRHDYHLATAIHEWAHAHQKEGMFDDQNVAEGAADAFAWALTPIVARRAGRPYDDSKNQLFYSPQAKRAAARGPGFIFRDQFKARPRLG